MSSTSRKLSGLIEEPQIIESVDNSLIEEIKEKDESNNSTELDESNSLKEFSQTKKFKLMMIAFLQQE